MLPETPLYCCVVRLLILVNTPGAERCFAKRDFCDEAHDSAGVPVATRTVGTARAVQHLP
jgi:hypothetical protein